MQTNFQEKNKSHLIRLTEIQKKKSRRRLLGSIFLLVIALVVLLKVTSSVTPIEIAPKPVAVEIKNTSSSAIARLAAAAIKESQNLNTANSASSPVNNIISSSPVVAANNEESDDEESESSIAQKMALKPRLITDVIKPHVSPEDILNGQDASTASPTYRYYVQLLASLDKNKLIQLQDALAGKGIKTIIQSVDTPNGIVYRLRIGPFSDKNEAQSMLDNVTGTSSDE